MIHETSAQTMLRVMAAFIAGEVKRCPYAELRAKTRKELRKAFGYNGLKEKAKREKILLDTGFDRN